MFLSSTAAAMRLSTSRSEYLARQKVLTGEAHRVRRLTCTLYPACRGQGRAAEGDVSVTTSDERDVSVMTSVT
eukprot:465320-Pyramimonas_sp.AAC.1